MISLRVQMRGFLPAVIVMLVLAGMAHAGPFKIFNTGVAGDGSTLIDGTTDTHYTLVVAPPAGGLTTVRAATSSGGYPIGPWLPDDLLSDWIGPNYGGTDASRLDGPAGDYTFRTTFDLTGYDPTLFSIVGRWSTDNAALDMKVNGVSTGNTIPLGPLPSGPFSYEHWTAFTIPVGFSGFKDGINTLDFVVNNLDIGQNNPVGLRVEMEGIPPVPEPATLILFGAGLVALGLVRRRLP